MTRPKIRFKKKKHYVKKCKLCDCSFCAADVKACCCPECKTPRPCLCGCEQMASSALHPWRPGHAKTEAVMKGHKRQGQKIKGNNNPSRQRKTRRKLSKSIQLYWDCLSKEKKTERVKKHHFSIDPLRKSRKRLDGFMSQFERDIYDILTDVGAAFEYERCFYYRNGRRFYPDFVLQVKKREVLIEVSGFAYEAWKSNFVKRIKKIKREGHEVLCVTYQTTKNELRNRTGCKVFTKKGFKKWLQRLLGRFTSTMDIVY